MPVYVDSLVAHAFSRRLGMKRAWFQPVSSPHYDLTESRRIVAVHLGAIELNRLGFVRKLRELRAATTDHTNAVETKVPSGAAPEAVDPPGISMHPPEVSARDLGKFLARVWIASR